MQMICSESIEPIMQHSNIVLSVLIALKIILAPPFDNVKFSLPIVSDNEWLSDKAAHPITALYTLNDEAVHQASAPFHRQ